MNVDLKIDFIWQQRFSFFSAKNNSNLSAGKYISFKIIQNNWKDIKLMVINIKLIWFNMKIYEIYWYFIINYHKIMGNN